MKLRLFLPLSMAGLLLASAHVFAAKKAKPAAVAPNAPQPVASSSPAGWFEWRGPDQNGTSKETGLPDKIDAKSPLWTADLPGQSAPVISNGKLYIMG